MNKGFTLIETLVAIAILAIASVLAAPSIQSILVKNKINRIAKDFQNSILFSRSEAANKNTCISMCMSDSANSNNPRCKTTDGDWQVGWIVFINPSCTETQAQPSSISDIIQTRDSAGKEYFLQSQSSSKTRKIFFTPNPSISLNNADEFDIIYQSTGNTLSKKYGLNICLDALGRTRTIPSDSSCANFK